MTIKIYNPDTNEVVAVKIQLPFSGYGTKVYQQDGLYFLEANNDLIKNADYHVLERYSEIIALSLKRKNQVLRPRKLPVYRPPSELPDCGFKLSHGYKILTQEVNLHRQRQMNVQPKDVEPEYFTYELRAGELHDDSQNNMIVAYADANEVLYFVDVYQYKKRILSEPCQDYDEAVRLFEALVTSATYVLYGIGKRKSPLTGQKIQPQSGVYYPIDWRHLPVYGPLFRDSVIPKKKIEEPEIDREAYYRKKLGML